MDRRTLDGVVAALVALVLVAGLAATWQAWQSTRQVSSGMMGGMMTTSMMNTGPSPLWLFFGTVAVAAIIAVGYLVVRENATRSQSPPGGTLADGNESLGTTVSAEVDESTGQATEELVSGSTPVETGPPAEKSTDEPSPSGPRPAILDVLPEDERRILEPILQSPGLTQIELRDRADFSKSKVSQTVSDLEKRGLVSRERQGRTYRLYPGEDLSKDS